MNQSQFEYDKKIQSYNCLREIILLENQIARLKILHKQCVEKCDVDQQAAMLARTYISSICRKSTKLNTVQKRYYYLNDLPVIFSPVDALISPRAKKRSFLEA